MSDDGPEAHEFKISNTESICKEEERLQTKSPNVEQWAYMVQRK